MDLNALPTPPPRKQHFDTTQWSVVVHAAGGTEESARKALEWLCRRYWFPLYAYARSRGSRHHDAEDLVQGFFERAFEKDILISAQQHRGLFRNYLLVAFRNYCQDLSRAATSERRGGGMASLQIQSVESDERYEREFVVKGTPEKDFDKAWTLTLFERAFAQLRMECDNQEQLKRFSTLKSYLREHGHVPDIDKVAQSLEMSTPALRTMLSRMRQRFREIVVLEVRSTVIHDEEVRQELAHLVAALAG